MPVLRQPGPHGKVQTPCHKCPKIPVGAPPVPASAIELSPRLYRCWMHYLECRATHSFPSDPLVRRHAAQIRMIEDEIERLDRNQLTDMLAQLFFEKVHLG